MVLIKINNPIAAMGVNINNVINLSMIIMDVLWPISKPLFFPKTAIVTSPALTGIIIPITKLGMKILNQSLNFCCLIVSNKTFSAWELIKIKVRNNSNAIR